MNKMEKVRRYTLEEVKRHEHPDDLWMIIYNKVFDITLFAQDHPGGKEVLFDCGGVDATEPFEDVGHSDDALFMLAPYFVGDVIEGDRKVYPKCREITDPCKPRRATSKASSICTNMMSSSSTPVISNIRNNSMWGGFKKGILKNTPISSCESRSSSNNVPSKRRSGSGSSFDEWIIILLMILALVALVLYICLQKIKWNYHLHL